MTATQPQGKNLWEDVRETVVAGLRDWRDKGEELARQGRIRMDEMQTERRLRSANEALGQKCGEMLRNGESIPSDHPVVKELLQRVRYYEDELTRLRSEHAKHAETTV
ncbi:MAG: hypothetical protein H6505_03690 [Calditrichaeota bacterium]|nr:hypothetical protein [Calditrichota bacterium]